MLVPESSISLYEQLKLAIKNDIINKVYKPGEKMPSEIELGEKYGVSRITVRRAIKELVNEGLLVCKQGKGTFVEYTKKHRQIIGLDGFTELTSLEGHNPQTKVLSKNIVQAEGEIAAFLQLPEGSQVLELRRLMLDDDIPQIIDVAYFSLNLYPDIMDKIHDNVSTYRILKNEYGIVMKKAYKEFSAATANIEQSKLLECSPGEPLFLVKKVVYDSNDKPVHLSNLYVLSSRVIYTLTVENNK